jgi:hypothetical protein
MLNHIKFHPSEYLAHMNPNSVYFQTLLMITTLGCKRNYVSKAIERSLALIHSFTVRKYILEKYAGTRYSLSLWWHNDSVLADYITMSVILLIRKHAKSNSDHDIIILETLILKIMLNMKRNEGYCRKKAHILWFYFYLHINMMAMDTLDNRGYLEVTLVVVFGS